MKNFKFGKIFHPTARPVWERARGTMLSFDFCTKHATPLREPPGTGTSGNSFKIYKTQTGQVPGAHFFTTNHVPGPFPAVPGGCRSPFFTTTHCSRTVPRCSRSPFFTTNRQFPFGKWHFSVSEALETWAPCKFL